MGGLLLELLCEEIPARMQRRAIEDLAALLRDRLAAADVPATSLTGYVTPRRLVVIADGIPLRQPDRSEERRGPRVGAPQPALDGFLRAAGLAAIEQCEVRATERGEFYFAVLRQPGRAATEVLPELIHGAMTALPWPKSMRYPASELRWVRPLNAVVCLFDGAVLGLPLGEVPVGRTTRGHRFLSHGEISVADAADYRRKLAEAHVVLDWSERRAVIARDLDRLARAEGLTVKRDEGLLDEVAGLIEYPVVLMGSIDADFVRPLPEGLPSEVLATAMRTHQKYFTSLKADGTPAPRFLFVANNLTPDNGAAIVAGNERVLRARLSDAKFFWDQDRKVPLAARIPKLAERVFHARLGSVLDKVGRLERLVGEVATYVPGADPKQARRAAELAKADLSTGMVGEFPELQGIMGRYYALNDGEATEVAEAIADHYSPLGPNDRCPSAPVSVALALADKLDTLVGFFSIGETPTGSKDPFALRRSALGMIRLIIENRLRLPLARLFHRAFAIGSEGERWARGTDPGAELLAFFADRLKVHLREQGVRHDLIAAVFALGGEDDLVRLLARVAALEAFLRTDDGANLLVAYRRAANIVRIEEKKDGISYRGQPDFELLREPAERALAAQLVQAAGKSGLAIKAEAFTKAMAALAALRGPVDEFFNRVTVNCEDRQLRENRLRLLAQIRDTLNRAADFSEIEG